MLQARLRGLGSTIETHWFELSPGLNLFNFNDQKAGTHFIKSLQTINPPYSCHSVRPFADFPHVSRHRGYLRRINPKKRTVAMAVFAATPALVGELANFSDLLYETDRIEIGRRLNYSRWINFVELASSTRWSEIAPDIAHLFEQVSSVAPHLAARLQAITASVLPSDRVKGELQTNLLYWLQDVRQHVDPKFNQLIDTTRDVAMRAVYFRAAREMVYKRLPLFLCLGNSPISQTQDDLLQWMGNQALQQRPSPSYTEISFLDDVNHQLSLLNFCERPIRIDTIDSTFFINNECIKNNSKNSPLDVLPPLLRTTVSLAIGLSRALYRTEPILLFDAPEDFVTASNLSAMIEFVREISQTCQCLYVSPRAESLAKKSGGKLYRELELIYKNSPPLRL